MTKIPLARIQKNPYDTREDYGDLKGLKSNIEKHGMLHGFLVRPSSRKNGEYELVFGGRRFECLRELGKTEVEAEVRDFKDSDMAILALCENVHRKDYNPAELARQYRVGLTATGYGLEEFAKVVGESVAKIGNYLKILDLPDKILSKSAEYRVHDLHVMSQLQEMSQTLRITYENVLNERVIPTTFADEIVRSCARIFSSNLPEDKKVELAGDVITQDYSHIAPRNFRNIGVYATQVLEQALIKYNKNLAKVAKAIDARNKKGTIIPKKKNVESLADIVDVNDKLDETTDILRTTTLHLERTEKKGYYNLASKRNQNSFKGAVNKLASRLETILKNDGQA